MHAEPDGIAIDIAAPTAHRVPAWRFDLDNLSAQISQQARGERGSDIMAKLHELEAGKGQVGGGAGHGPGLAENAEAARAVQGAGGGALARPSSAAALKGASG